VVILLSGDEQATACLRRGFEGLLPYFLEILIFRKLESRTETVSFKSSHFLSFKIPPLGGLVLLKIHTN
jgi:hypothetical protein